jgi:hypothetical protein
MRSAIRGPPARENPATPAPARWYPCRVIPTSWHPVRRPSDGETVGWLVADGAPDRLVPATLVGSPLGPAQERAEATALLIRRGLAALDGRWWARLPDPLPRGSTVAGEPGPDWGWRPVVLIEVSPTGCTVRPEMPAPGELSARAILPVPVGGLLRAQPPG